MKNLTREMIEKTKTAKCAEELPLFAKENGIDMTADEAATYFEQVNANSLDDDLLDGVAGGWLIMAEKARDPSNQEDKRSGRRGQCR